MRTLTGAKTLDSESGGLSRRAGGVRALPALFLYPLLKVLARVGSESEARKKPERSGKDCGFALLLLTNGTAAGHPVNEQVNGVDGKKRGALVGMAFGAVVLFLEGVILTLWR